MADMGRVSEYWPLREKKGIKAPKFRKDEEKTDEPPSHAPLDGDTPATQIIKNIAGVFLGVYVIHTLVSGAERGQYLDFEAVLRQIPIQSLFECLQLDLGFTGAVAIFLHYSFDLGMHGLFVACIYAISQTTLLMIPFWGLGNTIPMPPPLLRFFVAVHVLILAMKMHSYFIVRWTEPEHKPSLMDFFRYLTYPTFNYSPSFERTSRIRWSFVFERTLHGLIVVFVLIVMMQFYVIPGIYDVPKLGILRVVLRTILPIFVTWICFFFAIWHSFAGCTAELTYFANHSEFYGEWWTAGSWAQFWSRWNLVTAMWLRKHVYSPLAKTFGFPRIIALTLTSCVSVGLHEYIVWASTGVVKFYLTIGMLVQLFLALVMENRFFRRAYVGNFFTWVILIVGLAGVVNFVGARYLDFASPLFPEGP